MSVHKLQFGLDTFGEVAIDSRTGKRSSFEESLRNIVEEGKLAEKVGIDLITLENTTVKNILSQVHKYYWLL